MRLSRSQSGNALVIGLVAVAILAVLAWFFLFSSDPAPETPPGDSLSSLDADSNSEADTPDASGQTAAGADSLKAAKPGNEARALIARFRASANRPDLHDIHIRGVQFVDQGKPVDAYLLWFFAARDGHAPSALILGEMYDPEYFSGPNEVMESADLSQSYKWYLRAAQAGDPTADDRLSALHSTVEAAAAAGDEDARRLLLSWQ